MFASYACSYDKTRGRLYPEEPTPYRNEFERDRDRIIHSNAFKRLQYKTQVFVNYEGDHYRNRLIHSIEVSTIAKSLAKTLNLCEDLAETIGLAHDLGHTPFGHAGEKALSDCMQNYGGFSHNAHALRILTYLEQKYAAFDGLNLTWEVLEGIVKHNGPITKDVPEYIALYNSKHDLGITNYSSAESQLSSLSDDIAYICHDLEDSVRQGIITFDDLSEIEFLDKIVFDIKSQFHGINTSKLIYEVVRKLMHHLVESLLNQTKDNLKKQKIETDKDIRSLNYQLVDFTDDVKKEILLIKNFLLNKVYEQRNMLAVIIKCQKIVKGLFDAYLENIHLLPYDWQNLLAGKNQKEKVTIIGDYIAGMTDRFAIKEYQALFSVTL